MKQHFSLLTVLALAVVLFSSCRVRVDDSAIHFDEEDNSPVVTSVIKTKPFDKINIKGVATVYYTQGDTLSVKIKGTQKQIDRTEIVSDGATLSISTKNSKSIVVNIFDFSNSNNKAPEVYITSPDIIEVSYHGCGDFVSRQPIDTDTLRLYIHGTGSMEFGHVVCDALNLDVKGTGDIDVTKATAQTVDMQLKGTGNIDANIFNANRVSCSLMGTGNIDAMVVNCGHVEASLGGTGNITLKGDARSMKKKRSGIGDIDTDDLNIRRTSNIEPK